MIEQKIESGSEVENALKSYLEGTRLSMDQVAKKWEVSTAMLSQIKNGKKRAGIDLGLKILRESQAPLSDRRDWLEKRYLEESQEYSLVKNEIQAKKVQNNLKKEFTELLEENPILMDIFLDIALAEEAGISWNSIFKNYGEHGIELIQTLQESGTVIFKESRYIINEKNSTFITCDETSFGVVKAIIERQKLRKKRGNFQGELQYDVTDISKEAYHQLIAMNKEYVKQVRSLLEKNEMHRLSGGIRVVSQSLVSIAKGTLCLLIVMSLWSPVQAGGLRGGSRDFPGDITSQMRGGNNRTNDNFLSGLRGGSSDSKTSIIKNKIFSFLDVLPTKTSYREITILSKGNYQYKHEAKRDAIELKDALIVGSTDNQIIKDITNNYPEDCKSRSLIKPDLNEGKIIPVEVTYLETIKASGEKIIKYKTKVFVPCYRD